MNESATEPNEYQCPFLAECDFVRDNAEKMPDLIRKTRQQYCTRKEAQCARRTIYETLGARMTPPLMLPGQAAWARQIIKESQEDAKINVHISPVK